MATEIVEQNPAAVAEASSQSDDAATKAAEAILESVVAEAEKESAQIEIAELEAEDGVVATESQPESGVRLSATEKQGVAAAIKLAELRGGLQLDDGTVIPAEDVREYMKSLPDRKKWETALHQRGYELNQQEQRLRYGMTVQQMAAIDPRFDQGVKALERQYFGDGTGQAQSPQQGAAATAGSQSSDDLTMTLPEGYETDPLAVGMAKQFAEKLGRAMSAAEKRAVEIVEQRLQRLQGVEQYVGRLARERMSGQITKTLEELKITPSPDIMRDISQVASELGIDEYNPDARTDALSIVTRPYLLKRLTGDAKGKAVTDSERAPTTVPAHAGSGASAPLSSGRLSSEDAIGYRMWRDEQKERDPKAIPTVAKWKDAVAKMAGFRGR